jgi:hypothetical protein
MEKFIKELLQGLVLLTILGLASYSWAQAHDHAGNTSQDGDTSNQDAGQVFDSSQLAQQNGSAMQQRQGGMMRGGSGDGQGGMMQGGMTQHHEGGDMMQHMQQMRMQMGRGQHNSTGAQDAFSAIKAVVTRLEADPDTDWSRIDIDALRNHLVAMHQVAVNAEVETSEVEGGASYRVTGTGRTLAAIRNMVPMHASQITGQTDWTAVAEDIQNGIKVTVTAKTDDQVAKIRALGFMGFMVSGEHHEDHHLAIVGAEPAPMAEAGGNHNH